MGWVWHDFGGTSEFRGGGLNTPNPPRYATDLQNYELRRTNNSNILLLFVRRKSWCSVVSLGRCSLFPSRIGLMTYQHPGNYIGLKSIRRKFISLSFGLGLLQQTSSCLHNGVEWWNVRWIISEMGPEVKWPWPTLRYNFGSCFLGKGKAVPLEAWTGPEVSRKLSFPDFMTTAQDGGRLSALRTGRLYPPRKYSWYSFLLKAESTPGP